MTDKPATGQFNYQVPAPTSIEGLKLTPEEKYLYEYHLHNLQNIGKGGVKNPDGTISTLRQMSIMGPDGKTYNIPTVWGGKILNSKDAAAKADEVGWSNFPSYPDWQTAEQRYSKMHPFLEQDVEKAAK